MRKLSLTSLLLIFFQLCVFSQNNGFIPLLNGKFTTGDNTSWKNNEADDSQWKDARLGEVWQRQGFPDYHGYAWYRIRISIPSSLKSKGNWKDSLRIFLAHVNDVDETYLNGVKIGKTGMFPDDPGGYVSKWPAIRTYCLSVNNPVIKWDKENIIAVKVFDGGGSGGIFMGSPYIDMLEKIDGITIDESKSAIRYKKDGNAEKTLLLTNSFQTNVKGEIAYTVKDAINNTILRNEKIPVELAPLSVKKYTLTMPHKMGMEIHITFTETGSGIKRSFDQILPYILTPATSEKPRINGADVVGVRPGSPFLFKIPATGKKPISYTAGNLPAGLSLNSKTGIITGSIAKAGDYTITLSAKNQLGKTEKSFRIQVGDLLALTPPMGWNSWNCWGLSVSDEKVRSSALALLDKGLIDHGWTYMNIDDGWEAPERRADSVLTPNEKFPNMKGLGDFLHGNGLRFGIYSSPGRTTCGGFLGSYKNEVLDADTYASWGVDYLKYDLCSYTDLLPRRNSTLEQNQAPYVIMRDGLKKQSRDIVYSLCQYGSQEVWKWGPEMNGNLWRTTGDIEDTWNSLYRIGFSQAKLSAYAKPGGWNDPDMLILGMVGWGENLHPTRLTPYEQYTHMSLWSLLSAPLLLGCDISKLDSFTLNLLTNDEVIAVDQDRLGIQARRVIDKDSTQVWIKELSDGSKAIGIFNLSTHFRKTTVQWNDLALSGNINVRDLWQQKDLGIKKDSYEVMIPPHGVSLIKISNFNK